ncbi:multidrug and toxin extrusion protein 2-like, partial [Actinia tenebrosa]|uniref:Multidrug and toxin extrusion protein n=1 Tax=Actinia tenebrosa TaxID=6105 RepID=A0A6P8IXY7_ACTTE
MEDNEIQIHVVDHGDHSFEDTDKKSCCTRLISEDTKTELCEIYRLAWPTVFTHLFIATLSTQSIFFCGQIGKLELAAGTLGISFFNVFGFSIAIGLCSALDTLCSQAYGAKNFKMVGIVLQRGICILGIAAIFVYAFWITTEHFLLAIGIEQEISRMVDKFVMILIPILPALFGSSLLTRYLSSQGIVRPTLIIGFVSNAIALGLNFLFVIVMKQGLWGVAISLVIVFYCNLFLTMAYIIFSKVYKKTWMGWSCECLYKWKEFIWLALPGMLMICLEWWSFEAGAFLMGKFGESTLASHGVLIQLVTLTFMVPYGMSTAAAVRIGHNLGANKPSLAKLVMKLSIGLTLLCVSLIILVIVTTRKYIAMAFSNSGEVIEILIRTIPIMAVLSFFDATQGVCSGIVRGCGQQRIGVIINLISYDFIGLPLAVVLAFVVDMRLSGMWWGLTGGLLVQTSLYIILLSCTNWTKQAYLAKKRTDTSHGMKTKDKDKLIKPNGDVDEDKRNGQTPAQIWFSRASSLHDLDRITMTTSSADISHNRTFHTHSK